MIHLRQLLVEHPDLAYYKGQGYVYSSEYALGIFTIFKDQPSGKWISAVGKPNGDLITSEKELNDTIKNEDVRLSDTDYDIPSVHPALLDVLVNLGRIPEIQQAFEYRSDRADIPINGRVWKNRTIEKATHLVSLWCRKPLYEKYKPYVDKALHLLNVNPEKCKYETIEYRSKWFTYDEINSTKKPTEKEEDENIIKKLMRIQHNNPEAKKALAQIVQMPPDRLQWVADKTGTTVAALRAAASMDESTTIQEDPDSVQVDVEIDPDGEVESATTLDYTDYEVVEAVVCVGLIKFPGKPQTRGWIGGIPGRGYRSVFCNGETMNRLFFDGETHEDLVDAFYEEIGDFSYRREVHFRLFHWEGKYYAAFWEDLDQCRKWSKTILDALRFFVGGNVSRVFCQTEEMRDHEFISAKQAFRMKKKVKRTKSKEAAALAQQLHLMDPKQKAELLKKMNAMKPNDVELAADKLGMTAIELRQLLGMDIAENSLGDLSFSDYHDPSIPYEAKPRTGFGFDYGTVFEHLNRRRKRFR